MLTRRIGWRLNSLLTNEEREVLERLIVSGPEQKKMVVKFKALVNKVRDEHRVIFGRVSKDNFVTYKNYSGNEDEIPVSRLLWNFFPGSLDERGGTIPQVRDVAWTVSTVIALVHNNVRSLFVVRNEIETEIVVSRKIATIDEALNGIYDDPVKTFLEPIANEFATGLMMKR